MRALLVPVCLSTVSLLSLASAVPGEPTPYERKLENPQAPADPYYLSRSEWDAAARGPLPRHRLLPDGTNGTPPPPAGHSLHPRALVRPRAAAGPDAAPEACTVRSPAEYAPTAGVLFRFRSGDFSDVVTDLVAALTGSPAYDELAYVVVPDAAQQNAARNAFTAAGADLTKVRFIIMPSDSVWIRDYGPHFVWQGGADAVVDSHYYPYRPLDNFIPTLLADDYFVDPSYDMPLYYSGGNFQPSADGQGFATELVFADNPTLDESEIAELYRQYQGIDTLHIFPQLPPNVDGTGHIDMWMYLVDEDTVIISKFLPGSNPEAITITNNAVPYMQALGYEVFRVPAFNASHPFGQAHYSYTNAFRVNDRIFVTTYGEGNPAYATYDQQALAAWRDAAGPGVTIVPLDAYSIIWASGAFHCIVKQVPRYTDAAPSACASGPGGGSFLLPGSVAEVTWTAADDVEVAAVDLYYSTDGGATFPTSQVIATGLADDGSHLWTIPPLEADRARVRVVARDAAGSEAVATTGGDARIEAARRRVYDFASGAGVDRFAYGDQTTNWSQVDRVRRPVTTPLSAANYARLSNSDATGGTSDANRYASPTPSFSSESTHVFEFTLAEDPATIRDIGVRWEGFAGSCSQMELYVWDYVAGQWCDGRGNCGQDRALDNYAGSRDEDLGAHISGDVARYLDANGVLTLLLYTERGGSRSYHDYVSVTVTWDPCPGADADVDGWADGCDNCVAASNDQANADGDARGDACDCAAADGTVFAAPQEIRNVRLAADTATIAWDSDADNSGPGTVYALMQGALGQFPVGSGADETCLDGALEETSYTGLPTPASGAGTYQLVRGTNACTAGSWGAASDGTERTTAACP